MSQIEREKEKKKASEPVATVYEKSSRNQPTKPSSSVTTSSIPVSSEANLTKQTALVVFPVKSPPLKMIPLKNRGEWGLSPQVKEMQVASINRVETLRKRVEVKVSRPELTMVEHVICHRMSSNLPRLEVKAPLMILFPHGKEKSQPRSVAWEFQVRHIDIKTRKEPVKLEVKKMPPQSKLISAISMEEGQQSASATCTTEPETSPEELEFLDFAKLFFNIGGDALSQDKPLCIIVEKDDCEIHRAIAVILRDLYRERVGGLPTPIWKPSIGELKEEWHLLVGRKLIIVEGADINKNENKKKDLFEILESFFSQSFGFLVLVAKDPHGLYQEIILRFPSLSEQIIVANHDRLHDMTIRKQELLNLLLRLIAGMQEIEVIKPLGEAIRMAVERFDYNLVKKYLNQMEVLATYPKLAKDWDKVLASSPELEGLASRIHSAIKALIWIYEWRRNEGHVKIELESSEHWDVKVENQQSLIYEVETLYRAGDVLAKLTKKMNKVKGSGNKVVFVLRNIDILRHLRLLVRFRKFWCDEVRIEVKGVDLEKGELIDLDEFVKLMKEISRI